MASATDPSRRHLFRSERARGIALQIAVLAAVGGVAAFLITNLLLNLSRRRISTSYGYLERPAGFAIADSGFDSSDPVWQALVVGIKNTALVAVTGIALALVVGILVGIARLSHNWLVRKAAATYVEVLRNVPVLIVIIFVYTALILQLPPIGRATEPLGISVLSNRGAVIPSLRQTDPIGLFVAGLTAGLIAAAIVWIVRTRRFDRTGAPHHRLAWATSTFLLIAGAAFIAAGAPLRPSLPERSGLVVSGGLRLPPEFAALVTGLVLYTASHIAEIVRGSIQAVPRGQSEAATALGLREPARLRFVVLPQAFRIMIPPLANQFLNLTKNSSLAVFIGYPEITRITGITISQGNPAPQAISILMLIYLTFSLSIAAITNVINRRLQMSTAR